jgi:hemerythrin superfamily protein
MHQLLAHDHVELDRLLDQLMNMRDVKRGFERLDLFWARLAVHIRAEHLHLFPAIRQALGHCQDQGAPPLTEAEEVISKLRSDHDYFMRELASAIALSRQRLNGTSSSATQSADAAVKIQAIRERLVLHNRLEETQIYVWTDNFLSEEEQTDLNRKIAGELAKLPPRFAANTTLDDLVKT